MPTSSRTSSRSARRRGPIALLLVAFLALSTLVAVPAHAEDGGASSALTTVSDGQLTWGVKATWRSYAGIPILSGGVTQATPGAEFDFPLTAGTFDAETGTTILEFAGSVQWKAHYYPDESHLVSKPSGYTGPEDIYILHVTIANPQIVISGNSSEITVEMVSRSASTWEITDYGRVPLVTLGISTDAVSVDGGVTTWSRVPTAWTEYGVRGFGYSVGQSMDPATFSYTGPGGFPVLGETWTAPATRALELRDNVFLPEDQTFQSLLWLDETREIAHYIYRPGGGSTYVLQAFDLRAMEPVGASLQFASVSEMSRVSNYAFADTANNVLYYRTASSSKTPINATLTWSATDGYVLDSLAQPFTVTGSGGPVWDEQNERALTIERFKPETYATAADYEWYLNTYTRGSDGAFVEHKYALPKGPAEQNDDWYGPSTSRVGLAGDGSLILPGAGAQDSAITLRIEDDTVVVTTVAGTELDASITSGFTRVVTSGDVAYLIRPGVASQKTALVQRIDRIEGTWVASGDVVDLESDYAEYFAVDVEDKTLWGLWGSGQVLVAVDSTGVVGRTMSPYISQAKSTIAVAADHTVYGFSSDGVPRGIGETAPLGFLSFERVGISPTVTSSPDSATVARDDDEHVFRAAAEGTPAPTVQWQRRTPGALTYTDIPGATSPELRVVPAEEVSGTEYRAVFTNAAGSIATDPAALTVLYPPTIAQQPLDTAVQPGDDARFTLLAEGSPEPTITWQRSVDSGWEDVSGDGYVIDGASLTIASAQDPGQFRAVVSNSQGTVFSVVVSLTVELPQGGEDGSITGLPNSTGAQTTVTPGVSLAANGGSVAVTGSGFVEGSNEAGAYVLFGYVTTFPSEGGSLGVGYDYFAGQDNQRFIAWPGSATSGSANGLFTESGAFTTSGLVVASSFTAASGATVNCLDNSVQCGVMTTGAHGGRDANLETFTPVYFEGQSPNVTPRSPAISSHPASVTLTEGQDAAFSAGATGWPIPTVQWQTRLADAGDWVDIPGATASTYRVAEASLGASGTRYRAVFSNSEGTVTTDAATLTVTKAPAPTATEAGSLTWGVKSSFRSYVTGTIAKGAISLSGGASSAGAAFRFGQSSADWNTDAGTGSASYAGAVRFTGHAGVLDLTLSNPSVTVTSASSATLSVTANGTRVAIGNVNLAAASKSVVTGGVGYTNAPVTLTAAGVNVFSYGSSQFYGVGTALDPVTFVIGAASTGGAGGVTAAAFVATEWTPPADPPATEGIQGDPGDLAEVHAGQELTLWAEGFAPNEEGIKVVIYSEPLVLEENLVADADGRATWTGIIPASLEPGEHTLTFQGSVNRGIVLTVQESAQLEGCTVQGATLSWGFKESFRSYIEGSIAHGEWTVSDGATYDAMAFGWVDGAGVYDVESGEGQVDFAGTVLFTGHDGLLNTTIANPSLQFVDETTAYVLLDVSGVTMEDALAGKTDAVVVMEDVAFAKLDLSGGAVELSADGTMLTGLEVPAELTAQGNEAFPNYETGTEFDPVSFSVPVQDDCAVVVPAVEDTVESVPAAADEGSGIIWIWWTIGALLLAAVVMALILLARRRRSRADAGGAPME